MQYWLVVGSVRNWQIAFEHGNIWGLKETQRHLWDQLKEDDILLFYATSPVKGIIGYGVVRTKFRQDQPLWPQELQKNRVIWPLRFEFDVIYCLPPDKWESQKLTSKELFPRAGFQPLRENTAKQLIALFEEPQYPARVHKPPKVAEPALSHEELKKALIEIGKLQNFIAESEYPFDGGRLDVVWRRVERSVPTYVFEIQLGGNIYQALAKLKHAYDLWNSHIFLIVSLNELNKITELLSGTFHEIRDKLKVIDCSKVQELLRRKKSYKNLEKELGIS
mgnify:FL=1